MRSAREREAATRRAQFVELWEVRGVHSAPELAAILGVKPRHVERLIQEYRRGDMAKKIAKDRALDAQEAGDEPPEPPAPVQLPALPEDPGVDFDHMSVTRRICASDRSDNRDRIRAAEVLERRRQYDLDKGIAAGAKGLRLEDWLKMELADIPPEARPRMFGILAEEMANARTPWLSMPETTQAQIEVWHQLGLQVPDEEAVELVAILAPGRAVALEHAAELKAARAGPPPDSAPIQAEDYLDHVPGATAGSRE